MDEFLEQAGQGGCEVRMLPTAEVLPQILLSGMIFPLSAMASGVRWIAYFLPLTYFNQISRGVMIRGRRWTPPACAPR
jgi:ABC-type multidrug transport system permease subunit